MFQNQMSLTKLICVVCAAFSVAHWEQLQQEKEDVERTFQAELEGLRAQQQRELGALEERLKILQVAERERLQAEQREELQELRDTQQQQVCASDNERGSRCKK